MQYYKDPEKTKEAFRGEYMTVGDMGYLDEDNYLYIVDRKTDMVISGGVNIYPAEIEEIIYEHPAVLDVAVIGVPNEEWGEELKAVVQLPRASRRLQAPALRRLRRRGPAQSLRQALEARDPRVVLGGARAAGLSARRTSGRITCVTRRFASSTTPRHRAP